MSLPFTSDNIYTTNIRAVTAGTDITIGDDSQTRNISIGTGSQGTVSIANVTLSTDAIDTTTSANTLRIGTQRSLGIQIGRAGYNTFIAGNVTLQNTPTLTCDISGTATNANNVLVTRDDTSGTYYLPFVKTGGTGNRPLFIDDVSSALTYNPSTSTLTASNYNTASAVPMTIGSTATTITIGGGTSGTTVSIGKASQATNILGTLGVTGAATITGGVVTTSMDASGVAMNIGTNASSVSIGKASQATNILGTLGVTGAATITGGVVTTSMDASGVAMNIGTLNAGTITIGRTGQNTIIKGAVTCDISGTATNANNVLNAALTSNQYYPLAYFNGSTASTYYQLSSDVSSNLSYNPSTKDVKVSSTVTATTFNGNLSGTADVAKKVVISPKTTGTTYPTFVDTSGNVAENINTSFIYDASNNYLTATKFIGDLSGSATNVSIIGNDDTSGTYYLPFVKNSGSGSRPLYVDDTTGPLTYNPSTSTLTATNFDASGVAMNIGTNASSVSIGRASQATNILGTLGVTGAATITGGVVTTSMDASGVAMAIGGTNATTINIGRTGQTVNILNTLGVTGAATITGGVVTSSMDRATSGILAIGGSVATSVSIGRASQATNILGTLGVTGAATFANSISITNPLNNYTFVATTLTLDFGTLSFKNFYNATAITSAIIISAISFSNAVQGGSYMIYITTGVGGSFQFNTGIATVKTTFSSNFTVPASSTAVMNIYYINSVYIVGINILT